MKETTDGPVLYYSIWSDSNNNVIIMIALDPGRRRVFSPISPYHPGLSLASGPINVSPFTEILFHLPRLPHVAPRHVISHADYAVRGTSWNWVRGIPFH